MLPEDLSFTGTTSVERFICGEQDLWEHSGGVTEMSWWEWAAGYRPAWEDWGYGQLSGGKGARSSCFRDGNGFLSPLKERHNRLSVTGGAGQKYAFHIRAAGCGDYSGSVWERGGQSERGKTQELATDERRVYGVLYKLLCDIPERAILWEWKLTGWMNIW